jgi:hypothetical protein
MAATVRKPHQLLVGVLVVFVAGVFVFVKPARSVALLVPFMAGFVQATPDVWVERGTNAETRDTVVRAVALSNQRLRGFYGAQVGRPIVLACSTLNCFQRYGGIGHGTTYFGNRVLLGPSALNVVKVTHELSHAKSKKTSRNRTSYLWTKSHAQVTWLRRNVDQLWPSPRGLEPRR